MAREHHRPAAGNTGFPDHDPSADVQPDIDVARESSERQKRGPAHTGRTLSPDSEVDAAVSQQDEHQAPTR
jgi:hypothetical protein